MDRRKSAKWIGLIAAWLLLAGIGVWMVDWFVLGHRPKEITGQVLDPTGGGPIADAEVILYTLEGGLFQSYPDHRGTRTDAQGRFAFRNIRKPVRILGAVRKNHYGYARHLEDRSYRDVVIELPPKTDADQTVPIRMIRPALALKGSRMEFDLDLSSGGITAPETADVTVVLQQKGGPTVWRVVEVRADSPGGVAPLPEVTSLHAVHEAPGQGYKASLPGPGVACFVRCRDGVSHAKVTLGGFSFPGNGTMELFLNLGYAPGTRSMPTEPDLGALFNLAGRKMSDIRWAE